MADFYEQVQDALNRIASRIPLLDKTDLSNFAEISTEFESLSKVNPLPKAFKSMITRASKLTDHIVMGESDFDTGCEKLGQAVEKMRRSLEGMKNAEAGEEGELSQEEQYDAASVDGEMPDDVMDLLVKFASQQKPVLEDFEAYVLEYEKGAPQAKDAIKRILHTWKGEFGVLDLQSYAKLIHQLEENLEAGVVASDSLLKFKDLLAARIDVFMTGKAQDVSEEECEPILAAQEIPSLQTEMTAPLEGPASQDVPTSGENAFEGDPSLMGDFITESRDHIHTAESLLLELETDTSNKEFLNSIFRSCHTIKGVAGFLGLKDVNALAHSMENVMDLARKGELAFHAGHIDVLLESMDCLKELVATLEDVIAGGAYKVPATYGDILDRLSSPYNIPSAGEQESGAATKKVGEILVESGELPQDKVNDAVLRQSAGDKRKIGQILVEEEGASPRKVAGALAAQNAGKKTHTVEETIRVPIGRLDQLVDAIGEAVIAQSMVVADNVVCNSKDAVLKRKVSQANLIMRQVQELSMSLRMVSVKSTFQKMARLVRDLAKKSQKGVEFSMEGEDTELDKSVVENIGDPLIHMIRNSVDHGIEENADERVRAGKSATAHVSLKAFHKAGNIYIEIVDDGRGLNKEAILSKAVKQGLCKEDDKFSDQEIFQFIFRPGFSTAKKVTDVSGRGVGMDVVRRNIQSLRGSIEIQSEVGVGTTFSIRLPLTLAIIDGMIVRLHDDSYILPTLSIIESLKPQPGQVETVLNKGEIIRVRGDHLRMVRTEELLGINGTEKMDPTTGVAIIAEDMLGKRIALLVDEIVGQQQVVIKSLGDGIGDMPGVAGGAIMSDGSVSLILDVGGMVKMAEE